MDTLAEYVEESHQKLFDPRSFRFRLPAALSKTTPHLVPAGPDLQSPDAGDDLGDDGTCPLEQLAGVGSHVMQDPGEKIAVRVEPLGAGKVL